MIGNSKFFMENDLTPYAGKWVAILNEIVIASNKNIDKTLNDAKRLAGAEKFLIAKIPEKNQVLIL